MTIFSNAEFDRMNDLARTIAYFVMQGLTVTPAALEEYKELYAKRAAVLDQLSANR